MPEASGGEAAFRANLRSTVALWRQRLASAGSSPAEGRAVGEEARQLRAIAAAQGWWALAQHLENVEVLSNQNPATVPEAVAALARRLTPSDEPPEMGRGPGSPSAGDGPAASIALPPRLDLSVAGNMGPYRGPPQASSGGVSLPPMLDAPPSARAAGVVATPVAPPPPFAPPTQVAPQQAALPPPQAAAPRGPEARPRPSSAPLPESIARPPAPKLLVKDMLGLHAFGKAKGDVPPDPVERRPAPEPPQGGGLLGLGKRSPAVSAQQVAPPRAATPFPQPQALPLRSGSGSSGGRPPSAPQAARSGSGVSPSRSGSRSSPVFNRSADDSSADDRRPGVVRRRGAPASSGFPKWFAFAVGGVGLLAVSTLVLVLWPRSHTKEPIVDAGTRLVHTEIEASGPDPSDPVVMAAQQTTADVHSFGTETPEMRELIDQQSRCQGDTTRCSRRWSAYLSAPSTKIVIQSERPPPVSSWLLRLKVPDDFPLRDDPLLKGSFEYDAKHIVGRAQFQQRLFRCSAYSDVVESTEIKYGAPSWLMAVAFQESGCDPVIESPVGAKGMWQFMPESARAYGLRVVEDEVDERLSPVKATEAAIHFLADLERKVGSWDLALAAYNMGPYGLVARMARVVGGHPGFWDLARAGLLPEETARYVPAIEAHALVLRNLVTLDFSGGGAPHEDGTEIVVKPGMRLSLIARAARTSTLTIRELNRDFLQGTVPQGETAVRVPSSEAHSAESFLDGLPPDDKRDACVPPDFDWGKQVFEASPFAKSCGGAGPAQ